MLLVRGAARRCDDRLRARHPRTHARNRCGAGFAILPGVVLGAAMIALGVHRLSLILRAYEE